MTRSGEGPQRRDPLFVDVSCSSSNTMSEITPSMALLQWGAIVPFCLRQIAPDDERRYFTLVHIHHDATRSSTASPRLCPKLGGKSGTKPETSIRCPPWSIFVRKAFRREPSKVDPFSNVVSSCRSRAISEMTPSIAALIALRISFSPHWANSLSRPERRFPATHVYGNAAHPLPPSFSVPPRPFSRGSRLSRSRAHTLCVSTAPFRILGRGL